MVFLQKLHNHITHKIDGRTCDDKKVTKLLTDGDIGGKKQELIHVVYPLNQMPLSFSSYSHTVATPPHVLNETNATLE